VRGGSCRRCDAAAAAADVDWTSWVQGLLIASRSWPAIVATEAGLAGSRGWFGRGWLTDVAGHGWSAAGWSGADYGWRGLGCGRSWLAVADRDQFWMVVAGWNMRAMGPSVR
jgi:hypothetical protein